LPAAYKIVLYTCAYVVVVVSLGSCFF